MNIWVNILLVFLLKMHLWVHYILHIHDFVTLCMRSQYIDHSSTFFQSIIGLRVLCTSLHVTLLPPSNGC